MKTTKSTLTLTLCGLTLALAGCGPSRSQPEFRGTPRKESIAYVEDTTKTAPPVEDRAYGEQVPAYTRYVIPVGNAYNVGSWKAVNLKYCGMPNADTFSVSLHSYSSPNLYFPKDVETFRLDGVEIQVEEVNPLELTIRVQK